MKTAIDIVREWVSGSGADGLCNPRLECGCGLDDLAPCGGIQDCFPAQAVDCRICGSRFYSRGKISCPYCGGDDLRRE